VKATGIVRKVDELGRIVIPIELRRTLNIQERDSLEILVNREGEITLRKYQAGCTFCTETEGLVEFKGNPICPACIEKLCTLSLS
jgi:transcriptional pleiotropic regulator of transition state genes